MGPFRGMKDPFGIVKGPVENGWGPPSSRGPSKNPLCAPALRNGGPALVAQARADPTTTDERLPSGNGRIGNGRQGAPLTLFKWPLENPSHRLKSLFKGNVPPSRFYNW